MKILTAPFIAWGEEGISSNNFMTSNSFKFISNAAWFVATETRSVSHFTKSDIFIVFNDKFMCIAHKQTWRIELENSCEVALNFCQSRIWGDLDTINQAEISDCL